MIIISIAALAAVSGCNDNSLTDIYNKLTEPYRESNHENTGILDTALIVKAVDNIENRPIENTVIKLIPSGPYNMLTGTTDKFGNAVFSLNLIQEGLYSIEASITIGNKPFCGRGDFHLFKKNKTVITIYLLETPQPYNQYLK